MKNVAKESDVGGTNVCATTDMLVTDCDAFWMSPMPIAVSFLLNSRFPPCQPICYGKMYVHADATAWKTCT